MTGTLSRLRLEVLGAAPSPQQVKNCVQEQQSQQEETDASLTVEIAGKEARVHVGSEQGEAGNPQAIGNAYNRQDEQNQYKFLPDRWKKKMAREEANDEQGQGRVNPTAFSCHFD